MDDENLEVCLRMKGGNLEPETDSTMDDKMAIYMACIKLIRTWADTKVESDFFRASVDLQRIWDGVMHLITAFREADTQYESAKQ
eukprot:2313512-Prorocentrum_lima.AAC.1